MSGLLIPQAVGDRVVCALALSVIAVSLTGCSVLDYGTTYLSCEGNLGTNAGQLRALDQMTITDNSEHVRGSAVIYRDHVHLEGFGFFDGDYVICRQTDQLIGFASKCPFFDGVLDKVTGDLHHLMGDSLLVVNCKKTKKLVE